MRKEGKVEDRGVEERKDRGRKNKGGRQQDCSSRVTILILS